MAEIPLTMPKMSMTMDEGTITEWQVAEGDQIAKGDVVAVVMTDKVDMEVESPAAGVVTRLLHAEGDVVAVGERIALVASEEEDLLGDLFAGDGGGEGAEAEDATDSAAGADATGEPAHSTAAAHPSDGPVPPAVPLARKLARDHGLDLRALTPTGPHGTVRVKDVKEAIAASAPGRCGARAVHRCGADHAGGRRDSRPVARRGGARRPGGRGVRRGAAGLGEGAPHPPAHRARDGHHSAGPAVHGVPHDGPLHRRPGPHRRAEGHQLDHPAGARLCPAAAREPAAERLLGR
jgi:pyruvate dehydrogenase E2 component (dihydrolipoamide acetyltransferase)